MTRILQESTQRLPILCASLAILATASAAHAQPTFSKVFTPSTIGPGSVSTITFTITNGSPTPVTAMAFTDVLPANIDIADPANASTTCDLGLTGTLTAPDGGGTITLAGAQVGGFLACTITVDVTSSVVGMHTNPAITLSTSAGNSMSLAIDLTVATDRPGFTKSFAPSSVSLGGKSTLTLLIDNSANASALSSLVFTDNFPSGLEIADPANASTDCGGPNPQLTAVTGTSVVAFESFGILFPGFEVLLAGATCSVVVDVIATSGGMLDNVTGELTSNAGSSGKASDTLEVTVTPLAIRKAFVDDPVPPGATVTLEFVIDNFDRNFSATGVAFTDDLATLVPALPGLTFASVLFDDCLGTTSIGGGGTTLSLSGGTIAAEGLCTIRASLSVPIGATPGGYTNTSGAITGTVDGSPVVGNTASDELFIEPAPLLTKSFTNDPVNPGDTVVLEFTVTNTSPTSSATDITFDDPFPTIMPTASVAPGDGCCGAGSICTFTPLFNPPPPGDVTPATLSISGGTLAPAGMADDSCTFSITLEVASNTAPGLYLNTTSEITATVDGATRTGDPATDILTVVAAPDLTKVFSDPVAPGDSVTLEFTLTYPADASGDATGITFTDDLAPVVAGMTATGLPLAQACDPDGPGGDPGTGTLSGSAGDTLLTFAGGTLSPGESCTISVTLDVPAAAAPGTFTNTTSGVAATVDGVPATSAPATDDLTVSGLIFTKEFIGNPVFPSETLTLRFSLENISPTDDATDIWFTDDLASVLPAVPDLVPSLPPAVNTCGGTLSAIGIVLIYASGSVTAGSTCTIDVDVMVPAGTADGIYTNTTGNLSAVIDGSAFVGDPATAPLVVESERLSLTKQFTDDPVAPGDPVTLEFTLFNLDDDNAASLIDFTDDLGAALFGLTFDSVLFNDCGATVSGTGTDMITVDDASLAAGGSCTIRVSLTVPGGAAAGFYVNTTSVVIGEVGGFPTTGDAASDTLEIIQLLLFSKSFDGPTTATGTAMLTFTITNPGADAAANISFTDDLDAVISGLIATSLPATPCGAGSEITGIGFLTFSGGELPPMGGMCSFDVEVLVPANATAGTFPNVTSELFQAGLEVAGPATADLTIEPKPTFTKVFMPDVILAGGTSTVEFTIDNGASALAASSLAFTDALPAGVVVTTPSVTSNSCGGTLTATAGSGAISLTGGSVGAGASCTIQVDVTSITAGAHVNVTGDLTSTSGNSGTATDTLTVSPAADLSVTKSDGVTSATPGGSVTYTLVVTNPGPSADPSVGLSDVFPSPPLTCTWTSVAAGGAAGNTPAGAGDLAETLSMPAGSSVTYTAICAIDSDASGSLSNTATITPSITDTNPGNNSATDDDTVLVPSADLGITKTDGVTSAVPGGSVTYTIVATNNGLSDDPSVSVADNFPATLTCTWTSVAAGGATGNTPAGAGNIADTLSMPAGSSVTYTANCTIDSAATGTLSNTATITASVTDPTPGNNSATDDDTVLQPEADVEVTKTDGVTTAVPGQTTLTYTIVATNGGPSDDPSVSIDDTFPPDLTCTWTSVAAGGTTGNTPAGAGDIADTVSMPAGSSVTYTATCDIDPAATGTLSNTATVTASVTDPVPGNNSATDGDTVLEPEADLGITKDGPASVTVGEQLTYKLTVTNEGPSVATGVMVDDPAPAGLTFISATAPCGGGFPCDLGTLDVDEEVSIMVTFEVPFDYAGPSPIVNTATVSGDTTDNVPGNDSATAETDVNFDTVPPEVTGVATGAGPLAECDTVREPVTVIEVTLEDDQSPIENAGDVASYLLVEAGADRDFSTADCTGPAGDDLAVGIVSVTLTDTPPTAVAELNFGAVGLSGGLYRLLVCDTITDAAGNALDGDGDATPGGDFVLSFFRADPLNLFENGHFDDCPVTLDPWLVVVTAPNAITPGTPGADDHEASPLSASSRVSHSGSSPSSLAQCVEVEAGVVYDLGARWRFDPPLSAAALLAQTCEFFDAADCTGVGLGMSSTATLLEDSGGAWEVIAGEVVAPVGALSALCDFTVQPAGTDPNFDLYLDALSLRTEGLSDIIFIDGFESGDTSAWSSTQP